MTSCAKLSDQLHIKLKVAIQVLKTYIVCFINNYYSFWKLTFGHQAKIMYKVRNSILLNWNVFQTVFYMLIEKTSTFVTSIFRTTYRSSSLEVLSKKGVLLHVCCVFTEEYSWSHIFSWIFSCKLCKFFVEQIYRKKPLGDCFCIYESECSRCLVVFTRCKICSKLAIETPKQQNYQLVFIFGTFELKLI